jgi:hypothetical protein
MMRHGTALDDRLFEPPPPMDPEVAEWNGRVDKMSGMARRDHWIPNANAKAAYRAAYLAAPDHLDKTKE